MVCFSQATMRPPHEMNADASRPRTSRPNISSGRRGRFTPSTVTSEDTAAAKERRRNKLLAASIQHLSMRPDAPPVKVNPPRVPLLSESQACAASVLSGTTRGQRHTRGRTLRREAPPRADNPSLQP